MEATPLIPKQAQDADNGARTQHQNKFFLYIVGLTFLIIIFLCTSMSQKSEKMRDAPSASNNLFRRPADTEHLKCSWIFDGKHPSYVDHLKENRSTFTDDKLDLPMDCESIRSRHRFATDPTSVEERDFPIAISRQVYRDYYYHELVLAALYQPQNFYCFTIDGKAGSLFRRRFESLAKCFPNVVISNNTRPLFSSGYNLDLANIDCLKALRGGSRQWKYVMVLQNHDFPTKTNREMVQIFKWLNGTNDISITKGFEHRVDWNLTWTVNRIPVFKNDSKYHQKFAQNDLKISFAKGDNEMAVSREAIDFIFNEMNVESFVHKINRPGVFGVDELVFPTILSMPELNVPGHYTQECVEYRKMNPYITRRSNFGEKSRCNSKKFRHRICIYGVEDLRDHVHNTPYININKLMPSFDFNPIVCELESLYNRTYIQPFDEKSLDKQFYEELPHVRYHNTGRCRA